MSKTISDEALSAVLGSLSTLGTLVLFEGTKWSGKKTDKQQSKQLVKEKHAIDNSDKVIVNLMAGADEQLRNVNSAIDAARGLYYAKTIPFALGTDRKGARLLLASGFIDFVRDFGEAKDRVQQEVDKFIAEYDAAVAKAKANLQDFAHTAEYPPVDKVRRAFNLQVHFIPLPSAEGFNSMPGAIVNTLKENLHDKMKGALTDGNAYLWEQIEEHLSDRLIKILGKEPSGKIYDTLMTGGVDIADNIDKFNLLGDQQLAAAAQELRMLCSNDPNQLRDKAQVGLRASIAAGAQSLLLKIKQIRGTI